MTTKADLIEEIAYLKEQAKSWKTNYEINNSIIGTRNQQIATLKRSNKELKEHGDLREADLQFSDSERNIISGNLFRSERANEKWRKENGKLAAKIGKLNQDAEKVAASRLFDVRDVAFDNFTRQELREEIIRLDRALVRVLEQRDEYMRQRDVQQTLKNNHAQDARDLSAINAAAQANLAYTVHAKQDAEKQRDENAQHVKGVEGLNKSHQKRIGRLNAEVTRLEKISNVKKDYINRINDTIVDRNREIKKLKIEITTHTQTIGILLDSEKEYSEKVTELAETNATIHQLTGEQI